MGKRCTGLAPGCTAGGRETKETVTNLIIVRRRVLTKKIIHYVYLRLNLYQNSVTCLSKSESAVVSALTIYVGHGRRDRKTPARRGVFRSNDYVFCLGLSVLCIIIGRKS